MTVTLDLRWSHPVLMSASWTARLTYHGHCTQGPSADQSSVLTGQRDGLKRSPDDVEKTRALGQPLRTRTTPDTSCFLEKKRRLDQMFSKNLRPSKLPDSALVPGLGPGPAGLLLGSRCTPHLPACPLLSPAGAVLKRGAIANVWRAFLRCLLGESGQLQVESGKKSPWASLYPGTSETHGPQERGADPRGARAGQHVGRPWAETGMWSGQEVVKGPGAQLGIQRALWEEGLWGMVPGRGPTRQF